MFIFFLIHAKGPIILVYIQFNILNFAADVTNLALLYNFDNFSNIKIFLISRNVTWYLTLMLICSMEIKYCWKKIWLPQPGSTLSGENIWIYAFNHLPSTNLPAPCISKSCIKRKINLIFFSHFFVVPEGFHKIFGGTTKKGENKNLS